MKNIKIKKYGKKNMIISCIVMLAVVLLAYHITVIYAKYYAAQYNKGIAVASNLYFNSDKLTKIDELLERAELNEDSQTDIKWVKNKLVSSMPLYTSSSWSDGYCDIDINIQNFDSNILYNDANMDIEYQVDFILLDTPHNANYFAVDKRSTTSAQITTQLTYAENDDEIKIASYTGKLVGGKINSERYAVRISLPDGSDGSDYQESRILVIAYPISPNYLKKDTNQSFMMAGLFSATITDTKISIASQNFKVVQDKTNFGAGNYKTYLADLSGYIYNIKTKGSTMQKTVTGNKQSMVIKWREEYLDLNRFDFENYFETYDDGTTNYGECADDSGYVYLKIKVLPYTSINITFYGTEKFKTDLSSGTITANMFIHTDSENEDKSANGRLVHAYIEDETTSGN